MNGVRQFGFALRLAWRQLTFERGKLVAAILGVMFACVLVFMQLGFKDSLYASMSVAPRNLSGDLFVMHRQTEALWRTAFFSRRELMRAYALPEVERAVPLYIGQVQWKNPETQIKRTIMIWGSDPQERLISIPAVMEKAKELTRQNTVLFDSLSRPEFGPVDELLKKGPVFTEINERRMEVVGTYMMGASFAADGNGVTSDQNFHRIFALRNPELVDVGVIKLKPGSDVAKAQAELQKLLNEDVYVFNHEEMTTHELDYWKTNAPIGFIFGFGTIMGLVVGMVIVYQILFTDITNHLNEFATLKAMGYSHGYLIKVVMGSSLILACVGFLPGFALSSGLYRLTESVTFIPMPMPLSKILGVYFLILSMCFGAGLLAMRKMKAANPADMF